MSLKLHYVNIMLFFVLFVLISVLFQKIPSNENQTNLESKITQLEFQSQEMRNLLLTYNAKFDSINLTTDRKYNSVNISRYRETQPLSESRVIQLIDDNVDNIVTNKISTLRYELLRSLNESNPIAHSDKNLIKTQNQMYIQKKYDSITNENFKSNLILADEIIGRAISSGEFSESDAVELNNAAQDLNFDNRVFIMNKLSHAYNGEKLKGNFINYRLVNLTEEK